MKRAWLKLTGMERLIISLTLGLSILLFITFLALIPINPWWVLGFLYGLIAIVASYVISILAIELIVKKARSKVKGFFVAIIKVFINYGLHIGILFTLIAIDNQYYGYNFLKGGFSTLVNGPLPFYFYLVGLSVPMVVLVCVMLFAPFYYRKLGPGKKFMHERIRR